MEVLGWLEPEQVNAERVGHANPGATAFDDPRVGAHMSVTTPSFAIKLAVRCRSWRLRTATSSENDRSSLSDHYAPTARCLYPGVVSDHNGH